MYNHPSLRHQRNVAKSPPSAAARHRGWLNPGHLHRSALSADTRRWLLDHGSLTQRINALSKGRFTVQVLQQHWSPMNVDEAQFLRCQPRQAALIREVMLFGDDEPWVYARSVLPFSTLTGPLRHLKHFGATSLGQYIFNHHQTRRDQFQIQYRPMLPLRASSVSGTNCNWGRRSRFIVAGKPLLVSEFFLDSFITANAQGGQ